MLHALHSLSRSAGCCKCNLQHATSVPQAARLRLMGHLLKSLPVSFAAKPAYRMHRQGVTRVLLDSETAIWVLKQPPLLACIRGYVLLSLHPDVTTACMLLGSRTCTSPVPPKMSNLFLPPMLCVPSLH